jgi:acetyl-CoA C-acetyltransferase
MRASEAKRRKLHAARAIAGVPASPRRRLVHHGAGRGHQEAAGAGRLVGRRCGLYEVNEAFAVVTMAAMRDIGIPHDKMNVHGGACALGHPVGASGARILITLLHAMEKYGQTKGVAALCIGGGEATAVAIERAA